jgi:hypothetical protein
MQWRVNRLRESGAMEPSRDVRTYAGTVAVESR